MKPSLSPKSLCANSHGVLLIEMVMALALFTAAITGLVMAVDRVIDAEKEARFYQQLRVEMESLLSQTTAIRLNVGESDVVSPTPGLRFRVEIKLAQLRNAENDLITGLHEILVLAFRKDEGGEREVERARVYAYQP